MIPTTNFSYTKVNTAVQFKDLSTNTPTSWAWDFGDGTTSTEKNPQHTYSAEGFYTVTLTPTNGDGAGTPLILTLGVSSTIESPLDQSLWELINNFIPDAIIASLDPNHKRSLMNKWQIYLQPLVVTSIIESGSIHNELAYPPLENQLIAELVAHDLLLDGMKKFVASLGQQGEDNQTKGTGQVKKITTGPTDVEKYNLADSTDALGKAYFNVTRPGGILDQLKESICQLAKRIRIYLPICGQLIQDKKVPTKSKHYPTTRDWGLEG